MAAPFAQPGRRGACVPVPFDVHDFTPPDVVSCAINPAMTARVYTTGSDNGWHLESVQ